VSPVDRQVDVVALAAQEGVPQAAADDVGVSDPFAEEGSEVREQTARFRAQLESGPGHGSPYQPPLRDGLAGSSSGPGCGSILIRSSLLSRWSM